MRLDALYPMAELSPKIGATQICGLTADSRDVMPGYLFAALPGVQADGAAFAADAVARGAAAVLAEKKLAVSVPVIETRNPRLTLAEMAGRFFASQPATIAAVTGTNGKTSVASYLRQLWQQLGHQAASIGTIGVEGDGFIWSVQHTTPDPITLHAALRDLTAHRVTHLALEASSHGLAQYRLDGVHVRFAGFTNLTRDHLDYHPDEAAYLAAKQRLFTDVLAPDGVAAINIATPAGAHIAAASRDAGRRVVTTGTQAADLFISVDAQTASGQTLRVAYQGHETTVSVALIGAFQAQNLEIAMALLLADGVEMGALCAAVETLRGARGRMQYVGQTAAGASVYVDYAHTPDALHHALAALRGHSDGAALHVVFGCGGDRDAGKRPQMGAAAAQAEHVYVTDDNPRSEDPDRIRAAIMQAVPDAQNIGDRREAIGAALRAAGAGEIVLIAGKGHEQGQIIGDEVIAFDDVQMARDLMKPAGGAS